MKATKRSLWMSVISLILCFSMLVSTTFAWFTDEVTSGTNKIQAGTLRVDLELLDKETGEWNSLKKDKTPIFDYDKWEPGYVDAKVLKVENEGTLALKWVAKFYSEKQLSILADVIDVYVLPSKMELAYPADRSLEGYTCVGTLRTFINTIEETTHGTLEAGESAYLGIALKMREEAGNEYQGLSLGGAFDIRIMATQLASEFDSFDNQYDKDATFDDFGDTSLLVKETKTLVAGADSVQFDLSNEGLNLAKVTVPAAAIADPAKPVTVTFDGIEPSITGENIQAYAYDIKVTNLKANLTEDQMVTVVVEAPNALAAMQAYHNGVLIEDAVYDEVAGTITFKTASFSPFDFTANIVKVYNLEQLRAALNTNDTTAQLMENITVDLTKETGAARDPEYAYKSNGTPKYYNGVMINGKNVGLDLNGYNITAFCGEAYNSNSDVGALFFVSENGSLNITNTGSVETGFIKMASSIYAVWAPFDAPSYVDIYGGSFIADSYAGDDIGTALDSNGNPDPVNGTMKNENTNRALIYAGFGGNMRVLGGYFLYNNTPNDTLDRNNGAFNAKDFYEGDTPLLTIHGGVMLINKEYRQNPANTSQPNGSYDNYSVQLAKYCEVVENVAHSVKIDGNTYTTWCRVTERIPVSLTVTGYKDVFSNGDSYERGEEFAATLLLSDGTTRDVTDKVTISGYDSSTVGANVITVAYTSEEGDTISTTYIVRFIVPVKLTVEPKKSLYNVGEVKNSDFKVTVYDSTGVATTLSDFDVTIDGNVNTSGHVNVTITKDSLSATCIILLWNMTKLDGTANEHPTWWMIPSLFNVSGWSNHKVGKSYDDLIGQIYTVPGTGEIVSGFSNNASWKSNSNGPMGLEYVRDASFFDLTITNASRYTTLGINCFVGYDVPVSAFGYYFDDDMSTLKFASPNYNLSLDSGSASYLGPYACTPNYLTCDLYSFKPGTTHTVHWVAIFDDGIQTMGDWTVTIKAENKDDASYEVDPEKPNVNVIILAGQSNAAGSAPITDEIRAQYGNKEFSNVFINYINQEAVGNTAITYFTNGNNFDLYKLGIGGFGENYFGPELGLADYLSTYAPDETWYIIKYAPAGSELDRQWFGEAQLADRMIGYVKEKINILAQDYNVKLAGFVWMQGESDAANLAPGVAERYSSNEQKLMKMVRDEFAAYATRNSTALNTPGSGIVFVNGGIAASGVWAEHDIVNTAKKENSAWLFNPVTGEFASQETYNIANSIFVDTSTLLSKNQSYIAGLDDYGNAQDNNDQAHYCDESMLSLGTWFGTALHSMMINCP